MEIRKFWDLLVKVVLRSVEVCIDVKTGQTKLLNKGDSLELMLKCSSDVFELI